MSFFFNYLLYYVLFFPIFGISLLLVIPISKKKLLKMVALNSACLSFTSSLVLWFFFIRDLSSFQFVVKFFWLSNFNLNFVFGIDGISLVFVLLTTLLTPLCLLSSWNIIHDNLKEFLIVFLLLDFFLISTFSALDLFLFYIFFESVLAPMVLIIGIWGS